MQKTCTRLDQITPRDVHKIRNIHQTLNQAVKNLFNIALEVILKWFLTGHASLILKMSITTLTTNG